MRREAEAHAEEDRKRKELIEVRNTADNTAYGAEKLLRDLGDKVPAELKSQVEDRVAKVRQALNGEDAQAIRKATDDLNQVLQQVGTAAYQQSGPAAGGPAGPEAEGSGPSGPDGGAAGGEDGGAGDDEDVIDGEFRNA
jgi:molecular chaperone DnaK